MCSGDWSRDGMYTIKLRWGLVDTCESVIESKSKGLSFHSWMIRTVLFSWITNLLFKHKVACILF